MRLITSQTDLRHLREAGRVAAEVMAGLLAHIQPGITTPELEAMAVKMLAERRAAAPFRSFDGFNHATCISINEEIVNGPPSRSRTLASGDVVSIALGTETKGLHGKIARTVVVGQPTNDQERLLAGTEALFSHLQHHPSGYSTLSDVIQKIPEFAATYQLTPLANAGGSGIGKRLHDDPYIPNSPNEASDILLLKPGFAFVPMPMMSLGSDPGYTVHQDKWTQLTKDGSVSAHFADTLLVTESSLEILTRP